MWYLHQCGIYIYVVSTSMWYLHHCGIYIYVVSTSMWFLHRSTLLTANTCVICLTLLIAKSDKIQSFLFAFSRAVFYLYIQHLHYKHFVTGMGSSRLLIVTLNSEFLTIGLFIISLKQQSK